MVPDRYLFALFYNFDESRKSGITDPDNHGSTRRNTCAGTKRSIFFDQILEKKRSTRLLTMQMVSFRAKAEPSFTLTAGVCENRLTFANPSPRSRTGGRIFRPWSLMRPTESIHPLVYTENMQKILYHFLLNLYFKLLFHFLNYILNQIQFL